MVLNLQSSHREVAPLSGVQAAHPLGSGRAAVLHDVAQLRQALPHLEQDYGETLQVQWMT